MICHKKASLQKALVLKAVVASALSLAAAPSIVFADSEIAGWTVYQDTELGFSFPLPPGLTVSEASFELTGGEENPDLTGHVLTFRNGDGLPTLTLGVAPNPTNLQVEEWVDEYTPCLASYQDEPPQPYTIPIAGEVGWVCPLTQFNEPATAIYFPHNGWVFALSGNVFGSSEDNFPPTINEHDFQRVVDGFSFGAPNGLPATGSGPRVDPHYVHGPLIAIGVLLMAAGAVTAVRATQRWAWGTACRIIAATNPAGPRAREGDARQGQQLRRRRA